MKKTILLLLTATILTSCYTTRNIAGERKFKTEYVGAHVEDVVRKFGDPDGDNVRELKSGYTYTYYHEKDRRSREIPFTRFTFGEDDCVKSVQSTLVIRDKRFSTGKTIGASLLVIPVIIITAVVVSVN